MRFKYAIQTNTNGANANSIATKIETEIADLIARDVCQPSQNSRRGLQTPDVVPPNRRLAVVGIDSKPQDTIENSDFCVDPASCCNGNCHLVAADMTLITDNDDSDDEICAMFETIKTYMEKPNTIAGLEKAFFVSSDGCDSDAGFGGIVAIQNENGFTESNRDRGNFHKLFWPIMVLLLLLVCFGCYARMRRRNARHYDEYNDQDNASSMDGGGKFGEDTNSMKSTKYAEKERFLNTVDVHRCMSSACNQCSDGVQSTKFVRTTAPSTPSTVGTMSPQQQLT